MLIYSIRFFFLCLIPLTGYAALSRHPHLPKFRTLVLLGDPSEVNQYEYSPFNGVEVYGLSLPGCADDLKIELESIICQQYITSELLERVKFAIEEYYRSQCCPFVVVYLPEQDITDGLVQLMVLEGRLGEVTVSGACYFSENSYKKMLCIEKNQIIQSKRLLKDLAWMNRNPFRTVDAFFTPGSEKGLTDLELQVTDRFPLSVYVGGDNTGNEPTGRARWFAGLTWGNWLGHLLSYQYTTASNPHHFQSHTLQYQAPLTWRHVLELFGGYATVHPHLSTQSGFFKHSEGSSFQSSIRYVIPWTESGLVQEVRFGFDFKNTNNNLIFVSEKEEVIFAHPTNLTQFLFGYNLGRDTRWVNLGLELELYWSPGKLLSNETDHLYDQYTGNATVSYVYGYGGLSTLWYLPHKYGIFFQARGQLSDSSLLPSEQFGLGGYDTVRGYEEREFNADDAVCLNFEVRMRPFSLLRYFRVCHANDQLTLLAFADYGIGWLNSSEAPEKLQDTSIPNPKSQYLLGVGPGLRYTIGRYLTARCDWGIKLKRTDFNDDSRSIFHLGLIVSY